MMLRCRFLFIWLSLVLLNCSLKSVYPLSLRTFSYWYLNELKTSSLEEFLDKRSLIIFGNWLIICGGWFEDLLIYNNKLFGFLYGLYVPLFSWTWCLKSLQFQGWFVSSNNNTKRNRQRNIIWFNLPFSRAVSTNIGKRIFQLLRHQFPPSNKLHKIFNKNTVLHPKRRQHHQIT